MNNDPELDGKYLGSITTDFVLISDTLKEAAYQIYKNGFSNYPIFPICKFEVPIGQPLLLKNDLVLTWNYNASYLDEFVQREIISEKKIELFKNNYKNLNEFCCLFVIDDGFTKFVYIPYPED